MAPNGKKPFTIVVFPDENGAPCEVIPTCWLLEADWKEKQGRTYWPPFVEDAGQFSKAVSRTYPAEVSWDIARVELVATASTYRPNLWYSGFCYSICISSGDYPRATRKCLNYCEGQTINTETEEEGIRSSRRRLFSNNFVRRSPYQYFKYLSSFLPAQIDLIILFTFLHLIYL